MKKSVFKVLSAFAILALIFAALPMQSAQAAVTIIRQWNFENPNPADATDAAVYPNAIAPAVGAGNAGGVHASAATDWTTPVGNGSADSFSSNNWAVGDYYQFTVSTLNFTGIQLSWDQTRSSTGPSDFKIAYSTNGTTFTDFYTYNVPANTWSSSVPVTASTFTRDLSAITALDNQANIYFRLIATSAPSGTAGTNRVDNFTVNGTLASITTDPTGTGLANPTSVAAGNSTLLTVAVTPGANPTSIGLAVTCDLTAIGGSASQTFYDDWTNGDVTISDNTFSFLATVDSSTSVGAKSLPCTITDAETRNANVTISLTVQAVIPAAGDVVISQVYGGGGNSGATLKNDFIELYNRTANTIDLTGWSVQYASATGTSWAVTALSGSIAPGKYYLVQEAAGSGGTLILPTPDATGSIAMSATNAKVALVNNATALTGACPTGSNISDFVGYGTANCSETSPFAALSNTTAAIRNGNGSVDTNNNASDFTVGAPNPRNSMFPFVAIGLATPAAIEPGDTTLLTVAVTPGTDPVSTGITVSCDLSLIGGSATQTLYDDGMNGDLTAGDNTFSFATTATATGTQNLPCRFADAQDRSGTITIPLTFLAVIPIGTVNGPVIDTDDGTTHASPYVGQTVTVKGLIYEKTLQATSFGGTYNGFFIQNTAATADGDLNTSDGLFVYMGTYTDLIGGYVPAVGDEVVIAGTISEYYNMTELSSATLIKMVSSGNPLLTPVVVNPPANLDDANRYWERLQGMRVQVPQNSIVLGGRNVFSPADAEIWVASPDSTIGLRSDLYTNRAFRDAHPLDDNYDAANWDGNGYRILMGSLGIKATEGDAQVLIAPARTFDTVTNAPAGGLNYTFSKYRIEISEQPTFAEGVDPAANNPPTVFDRSIHYTIADYNLENLYDYRDNPFSGCDFAGDSGCSNTGTPFLSAVSSPYDYVPASDAVYQARLNDISLEIINDLHSPDILMVQEVENQDICIVDNGALVCGTADNADNADGKPDVLQELALKIAANGGPAYDAAFDRDSSDLRGIAPAFLYRTDRVQLVDPTGDPLLGTAPAIDYAGAGVPANADVSNPKTLNAVLPSGISACETSWVFPRAPDIGLFRIFSTSIGVGSYRDVYVVDNHFKSGPDTCVAHRTEQAKYNAALVAFIENANPNARIVVGGDLNVYPRPDDIAYNASDQLGSLYDSSLGLKNLWEVLLGQAPESAYSYVYLGMAQTLDQMFVNQAMLTDLTQFRIAHINSDFPADYPGDVARGTSDHDPNVATFVINDPPTVDAGGPYTVNEDSSVTLTATGTDPEDQPLTYAWDLDNNGTFETPGQSVTFAGVDGPATLAVNVQVTDNGGLTAVASATVTVNNVAPAATFNAPPSVDEGSDILLSLTSPVDVPADLGTLLYAFDCGSGYGAFSVAKTASCPTVDNGTRNVGGKVMDKDGGVSEYTATVTINNVAPTVDTPVVSPEPSAEGSSVTASATFSDPGVNDAPFICTVNYGDGLGDVTGIVSGNVCTGPAHVYLTFGSYTVTITVTDKDGGAGSNTATHTVIFNWTGFLKPIDNLPAWNSNKAGSAVPVKFSLGGNKSLNIFAAGYPQSVQINCNTGEILGISEQTVNPGGSSMSYGGGQYNYIWKTDKAWAGTCRQLVVMLNDGTVHLANFQFK
jgi:predicted extracellular nuclease